MRSIIRTSHRIPEKGLNSRKQLSFFNDAGTMREIIILIIIIIAMGSDVHAMKPYYGSVIHQWNKQFELGKYIDHYAKLGGEKLAAIELSQLPKSVQPCRHANLSDENASQKAVFLRQNASQEAVHSGENISQRLIKTEEPAQSALMEFRYFSILAQNSMNLPCGEDLFRCCDVWKSIESVQKQCNC